MLEESRGTATGGAHAERGEAPLPPDLSFHPHSHSASVARAESVPHQQPIQNVLTAAS